MAGWNTDIDFEHAELWTLQPVLSDILRALNERCDAADEPRPFFVATGEPSVAYSGAVTSITINFGSDPGTFSTNGIIMLYEGSSFDEVPYTGVSGTGAARTFTVSATLTGSYTDGGAVDVIQADSDEICLYSTDAIMGAVDSTIDSLISRYADHTQATGTEFVGLTQVPLWTEAALLIAIGDSERIAGKLYVTGAWVAQVHNIINKLLWVNPFRPEWPDLQGARLNKAGHGSTWPLTEADFAATAWSESGSIPANRPIWGYSTIAYTDNFSAHRAIVNYQYNTRSAQKHVAELYLYTEQLGSSTSRIYQYDGEGVFAENETARCISNPSSATYNGVVRLDSYFDAIGAPPKPVFTQYVINATGSPNGTYSGAITSVTVDFPSDPGLFNQTGWVGLSNPGFDLAQYTAVTGTGTTRTFTVSITLFGGPYTSSSRAECGSNPSRDPTSTIYRGWNCPKPESYLPLPYREVVLRCDVTDGFDFK